MMIQKKDRFKAIYNGNVYEVAGRWDNSIVLSPIAQTDERCLIYTPEEITELLETGKFQREEGCK